MLYVPTANLLSVTEVQYNVFSSSIVGCHCDEKFPCTLILTLSFWNIRDIYKMIMSDHLPFSPKKSVL